MSNPTPASDNRRVAIWTKIKDTLIDQIPELAGHVYIGAIHPSLIHAKPIIQIVPGPELGELQDGEQTERQMEITVTAIIKADRTSSEPELIQVDDAYHAVQLVLETLVKDQCDGLCVRFFEDGEVGIQAGGYHDVDGIARVSNLFIARYRRPRGDGILNVSP